MRTEAPASIVRLAVALAVSLPLAGVTDTSVIGFDLDALDESGLYGPPSGRRALDYEYCIPRGAGLQARVRAIDPSARFLSGSRGRVGCGSDEVLVLGNTHQAGWREVLGSLAELPYVRRIEQAWLE